jgi:hypothetical protein
MGPACELGFRGSLDEWQRIGDEIKVAFGFSRTYFVFVRAG